MSWNRGDLALCIADRWEDPSPPVDPVNPLARVLAPRRGSIWTVARVVEMPDGVECVDGISPPATYLILEGQSGDFQFNATEFRKIKPLPLNAAPSRESLDA